LTDLDAQPGKLTVMALLPFDAFSSNTLARFSPTSRFQVGICAGWISYLLASVDA